MQLFQIKLFAFGLEKSHLIIDLIDFFLELLDVVFLFFDLTFVAVFTLVGFFLALHVEDHELAFVGE